MSARVFTPDLIMLGMGLIVSACVVLFHESVAAGVGIFLFSLVTVHAVGLCGPRLFPALRKGIALALIVAGVPVVIGVVLEQWVGSRILGEVGAVSLLLPAAMGVRAVERTLDRLRDPRGGTWDVHDTVLGSGAPPGDAIGMAIRSATLAEAPRSGVTIVTLTAFACVLTRIDIVGEPGGGPEAVVAVAVLGVASLVGIILGIRFSVAQVLRNGIHVSPAGPPPFSFAPPTIVASTPKAFDERPAQGDEGGFPTIE